MPRDLFVAVEGQVDESAARTCGLSVGLGGVSSGDSNSRERTMAKAKTMSSRQFQRTVSPKPSRTGGSTGVDLEVLLLQLGSGDTIKTREAASAIRMALKNSPGEMRLQLQAAGGIDTIMSVLASRDKETVEHAITAVLSLSLLDGIEPLLTRNRGLEAVVQVLVSGTLRARETAAAAVFTISSSVENKVRVRQAGGIPALVELLKCGTLRGKKDAALALFNLTLDEWCAQEIIKEGAATALFELLQKETEPGLEDKVIAVVANLAKYPDGRRSVLEVDGAVETLVDVIDGGSTRSKEDAVVALFLLATHIPEAAQQVLEGNATRALTKLAQSGTPRAKAKSKSLLELLRTNQSLSTSR